MHETDEALYRRFLACRAENDFRILLERHRESLILFLNGYVHNLEDAEELMLDAYAEAAAREDFSGRSSFKTWLFSIGKHLALMRLRKRRVDFTEYREEEELAEPPEFELLKKERDRQLFQALQRLNPEYRQVLVLLYYEQMTHEEAGAVMGKRKKQIYNLAERGKKALKGELERMGFGDAQY